MIPMAELLRTHAAPGHVSWIGLRPERLADMLCVDMAELLETGLVGDHARPGKRALTLIQAEHLPVIAALAHREAISPQDLRRNIVVSGINLTALHNHPIRIGGAVVRMTTPCAPCSRMEKALGTGAYNAMRGHGGWCAEVVEPGPIQLGDRVEQIA